MLVACQMYKRCSLSALPRSPLTLGWLGCFPPLLWNPHPTCSSLLSFLFPASLALLHNPSAASIKAGEIFNCRADVPTVQQRYIQCSSLTEVSCHTGRTTQRWALTQDLSRVSYLHTYVHPPLRYYFALGLYLQRKTPEALSRLVCLANNQRSRAEPTPQTPSKGSARPAAPLGASGMRRGRQLKTLRDPAQRRGRVSPLVWPGWPRGAPRCGPCRARPGQAAARTLFPETPPGPWQPPPGNRAAGLEDEAGNGAGAGGGGAPPVPPRWRAPRRRRWWTTPRMCPSTSGARRSWRCAKPGSGEGAGSGRAQRRPPRRPQRRGAAWGNGAWAACAAPRRWNTRNSI